VASRIISGKGTAADLIQLAATAGGNRVRSKHATTAGNLYFRLPRSAELTRIEESYRKDSGGNRNGAKLRLIDHLLLGADAHSFILKTTTIGNIVHLIFDADDKDTLIQRLNAAHLYVLKDFDPNTIHTTDSDKRADLLAKKHSRLASLFASTHDEVIIAAIFAPIETDNERDVIRERGMTIRKEREERRTRVRENFAKEGAARAAAKAAAKETAKGTASGGSAMDEDRPDFAFPNVVGPKGKITQNANAPLNVLVDKEGDAVIIETHGASGPNV
jgi:hypothetical protein